jgi:hypothetical protein
MAPGEWREFCGSYADLAGTVNAGRQEKTGLR